MRNYPPINAGLAVAAKCETLYRKYVGAGAVNLSRLSTAVSRELQSAEARHILVSRDLLRELRADRNWISQVEGASCDSFGAATLKVGAL